jgi:membrane fusion protein, adhesin transport system
MKPPVVKRYKPPIFDPRSPEMTYEAETRGARMLIRITAVSVVLFLVWAWFAELDQVTRAPGSVIASSRSQVVQAIDGGTLKEMLVREGDRVDAGQLLAKLDKAKPEASFLEARAKAAALKMTVQRLQAELFDKPLVFGPEAKDYPQFRDSQVSLMQKRKASIRDDLAAIEGMRDLAKTELDLTTPLLATGDVSRAEVLRLQRQVADLNAQIANKRNKYFQDTQAELGKAQEDLAGIEQILAQRKESLDAIEFRSPMRGVVKNIRVTTIGGVLRPGEELLQIVPMDGDLLIEAKIRPSDVGFVRVGQEAGVKIDAYDYTIYGSLKGKLVFISPDTVRDESLRASAESEFYRVRIQVENPEFTKGNRGKIEIQPGMTATVEIKTGTNTVLGYLTKPVTKTLSESFRER